MVDFVEKTYDFAQDTTKQLITLASAIVALTITFYKDFATGASECSRNLMGIAWVVYAISILGGLATLIQLTAKLAKEKDKTTDVWVVVSSFFLQQLGFLIALVLTIWAGWLAMGSTNTPVPVPSPPVTTSNAPAPTPAPPVPRPDTAPTPDIAPTLAPAPPPPGVGR
jgi:hypothetical protein